MESRWIVVQMLMANQASRCTFVTGSMGCEQTHSTFHAKEMRRNGSKGMTQAYCTDACVYVNRNLQVINYHIEIGIQVMKYLH